MTKLLRWLSVALILGAVASAHARSPFTLIVAPARYSVMQVAFDVVQRNPALLVSYQNEGTTAEPLLHVWNGHEWQNISLQDFREVSFVDSMPSRTVLVGDEKVLPASVANAATWSPEIVRVTDLNTAALVNEFGRLFRWNSGEWKWFAQRYNLKLNDETEALRKSSWYDQRGPVYRPPLRDVLFERKKQVEPTPAPVTPVSESPAAAPVTDTTAPAPVELP